ncbi:hypothetical protein [Rhizobium sp. 11515TR]|uniref:hypothetical protein n=1 Tax=Rhizobium sp. 11515TR TaxID=2028343 RepID=UPI0011B58E8C|nr:hypothetical protein [Rhizobium sp. 11515TR]
MAIANSLQEFQADVAQCDSLIANAHRADAVGVLLFTQRDREQITEAAFLNLFIAWEGFVEAAFSDFMMGDATVSGAQPAKYVSPPTREHSSKMVIHTNKYFDFSNHEAVKRLAKLYFDNGYPIDGPVSSIIAELGELKSIRNACAHISTTTTAALEGLANRILGQPQPGISVYRLLTMVDPRLQNNLTVYAGYRDKLLAAAALIAQG